MKMNRTLWLRLFSVLFVLLLAAACGDDDDDDDNDDATADDDSADDDATDDDTTDDDSADDDDEPWTPVEPHRETYENWTILWLAGTPYEMGLQQGQMMHEELAAGHDWLNTGHLLDIALPILRMLGLVDLAEQNSYPDVLEECRGINDAAADVGFTYEVCLLLNFGDVLVEFLGEGFPPAQAMAPGCTQIAAAGAATVDGRMYHGRSLDWSKIDFLLDYPVIHVRQPDDGQPHAFIGFPGNLSPYSGINAAGLSVASNEADPLDNTMHDRVGRSHVQLVGQLLKHATNLDEAKQMVQEFDHMTVEIITVVDGPNQEAAVFEMSAKHVGVRELSEGVVYTSNHFIAPETVNDDAEPISESSAMRLLRLQQLADPNGEDTLYGDLDPAAMIAILRDRVDPETHEEYGPEVFDNNRAIATNGAIYQIVFDPESLLFWVAAGALPVPAQPFVGFSLGELLGLSDAVPVTPPVYE